jgi:hypothetical protein
LGCEGELSKSVDVPTDTEGDAAGECDDGIDNDENDLVDCDDPGCAGSPDCSDSAPNDPPSAPVVEVQPAEPMPGEPLSCTILELGVDPEGESVTHQFSWEVGGAGTTFDGAEVPEGETRGRETWTCVVVAFDGVEVGEEGRDSVVTAAANTAPESPAVAIVPAEPATNQPLRCDIVEEAVDPEDNPVSYRIEWLQDDTETTWTEATLPASATAMGEEWTCQVTATDGELDSPMVEARVTIGEARYSDDITGLGGTLYAASSCFGGCDSSSYAPENAFDDNRGTAGYSTWHATWTGGPEWISVDFGDGNDKTITRYGLMGASFHEGYRVRDFSLQGSHDGELWDTIDTVTDANLTYVMYGGEPLNYYEVEHDAAYRHWRYLITANEGGQTYANEVGIVEIEMFEAEAVE